MKRYILLLLCGWLSILAHSTLAQVSRYIPDAWQQQPRVQPLQRTIPSNELYTVTSYITVRDFNLPPASRAYFTHYRTIYKRIRVNSRLAADSLDQLVLPLEAGESPKSQQARIIYPDGHTVALPVRNATLKDGGLALVLTPSGLEPGCEVEYDITLNETDRYAGMEYMQSPAPCEHAQFMLVAPANMQFRVRSANGFPEVKDSMQNGVHYLHAASRRVPALEPGDVFYYRPHLQRVEFALHAIREEEGKDTVYNTWKPQVEQAFQQYMNIAQHEYKRLQKEVSKWSFVQQRMPLPVLVYQVEQYIKSNYQLVHDENTYELADLSNILNGKTANETGFIRFLSAVYYMLGVPCQLLFTTGRDAVQLDSNLVNMEPAKNVLLYFPTLQQALAPTVMDTRFPYYPPVWAGSVALRCRDTLVDKTTQVLVDFIRTPMPDYTQNRISLEATLTLHPGGPEAVQVTQSLGGYPGITIRDLITNTPEHKRQELYTALQPVGQVPIKGPSFKAGNETWNAQGANAPLTLQATFNADSVSIAALLSGLGQQQTTLPPPGIPAELSYPFYQESRINIALPPGYRVANPNDYTLDIHSDGSNPALGYKITSRQEGNNFIIYALRWFRQLSYDDNEKRIFQQILDADIALKAKRLRFEK